MNHKFTQAPQDTVTQDPQQHILPYKSLGTRLHVCRSHSSSAQISCLTKQPHLSHQQLGRPLACPGVCSHSNQQACTARSHVIAQSVFQQLLYQAACDSKRLAVAQHRSAPNCSLWRTKLGRLNKEHVQLIRPHDLALQSSSRSFPKQIAGNIVCVQMLTYRNPSKDTAQQTCLPKQAHPSTARLFQQNLDAV